MQICMRCDISGVFEYWTDILLNILLRNGMVMVIRSNRVPFSLSRVQLGRAPSTRSQGWTACKSDRWWTACRSLAVSDAFFLLSRCFASPKALAARRFPYPCPCPYHRPALAKAVCGALTSKSTSKHTRSDAHTQTHTQQDSFRKATQKKIVKAM